MQYTRTPPHPWYIIQWMCLGGLGGQRLDPVEAHYRMWLAEDSHFVWALTGTIGQFWLAPAGKNGKPMVRCARTKARVVFRNVDERITVPPLIGPRSPVYESTIGRPNLNPRPVYSWSGLHSRWIQRPGDLQVHLRNLSWRSSRSDTLLWAEQWHAENCRLLALPSPVTTQQSRQQIELIQRIRATGL